MQTSSGAAWVTTWTFGNISFPLLLEGGTDRPLRANLWTSAAHNIQNGCYLHSPPLRKQPEGAPETSCLRGNTPLHDLSTAEGTRDRGCTKGSHVEAAQQ